ncbi:MAG: hypothetical protein WB502_06895 [Thermoactinomyces sp.]
MLTKCEKAILGSRVISIFLLSESVLFQGKRAKLFDRARLEENAERWLL